MTRWVGLVLLCFTAAACDSAPPPRPSDAAADRADAAPSDAAAPARCASDRECSAMGLVCNTVRGACVECNGAGDCTGGRTCIASRCVQTVPCTSSRMCPGQVCSTRLGYCVDCEADIDCSGGTVCRSSVCVPPPPTCRSSRECSGLGLVCDASRGVCVECTVDTDCPMDRLCGPGATCDRRACAPGAAECVGAARVRRCDARGSAWAESDCPAGQSCAGGACRAAACAAGSVTCADASTRRVCNAEGSAFTLSPCAAGEACDAGACIARVCTPGAASCQGGSTRRVCNADGRGYTETPCAAGELCDAGACVPAACTPGSASCADGTSRRVCNADGRGYTSTPCPAMQGCVMGACVAFRCTPGSATCADAATRSVCGPDGQGSSPERCAAMQTCVGGACRPWVCAPGTATCASASARSVCNADGLGSIDTPCAAGETCSAGACAGPTCTPGSATCADATTRRVCNADGRGHTNAPCAAGETCSAGACTRPTMPVCAAGAAFCDATGGRRQCNADGSASAAAPCPAGQVCTGAGACLTPTAETCPGMDVPTDGTPVTVMPSSLASRVDLGTACAPSYSATGDVVFHFRLASPRDVTVVIPGAVDMPMQIQRTCVPGVTRASSIGYCNALGPYNRTYRNLDAGDYYIVLYYRGTSPISVAVTATDPTARSPGDGCRTAVEATPDGAPAVINGITAFDMQIETSTVCGRVPRGTPLRGDWYWRFRNDRVRDLRITATGMPRVQVFSGCDAAARPVGPCASNTVDLLGLPAGDYVVVAEGQTTPPPASSGLTITTLTPGAHPIGDLCERPAELTVGGPQVPIPLSTIPRLSQIGTLSGLGSFYGDSQGDVVWRFSLAARTSVQITMGLDDIQAGAVAQLQRTCGRGVTPILAGSSGGVWRAYDLEPGEYYFVAELADRRSATMIRAQVTAIATPAAPTPPRPGETCATPIPITPDGPTVTVTPVGTFAPYAQFNTSCGVAGAGLYDYVLSFTLAREQDVTLTVGGTASSSAEIVTACGDPATSINGCVGSGARTFPSLRAGTYFIHGRTSVDATTGQTATFAIRTADPGSAPFTYYVARTALSPGDFVSACGAPGGIEVLSGTRDDLARVPVPFDLRVWGAAVAAGQLIGVASNGFLSLETPTTTAIGAASPTVPSIGAPNHTVAPFWFQQTAHRQGVCTATIGAAPNRRWVVEWVDGNPVSSPSYYTNQYNHYEVVFYEGRRDFEFLYEALDLRTVRTSIPYASGVESRDGMQGLSLGLPRPYTRVRLTPVR